MSFKQVDQKNRLVIDPLFSSSLSGVMLLVLSFYPADRNNSPFHMQTAWIGLDSE